jgi:hypothetical protein
VTPEQVAALETLLGYVEDDEADHWYSEASDDPNARRDAEGDVIYDPALVPNHIFHSVRTLRAMLSERNG